MTLDERIALAKDLIAKREEIDTQLAELFVGNETSRRPYRKRKVEEAASDETPRSSDAEFALDTGTSAAR